MPAKKVLVFGGNSLLGCATVMRMLTHDMEVTVANRGNWCWDTDWRVKSRVKEILCDRNRPLVLCPPLMNCLQNTVFDAVVDFSTFDAEGMQDAVTTVREKASLYVYMSSDAIYEVCQQKAAGAPWTEEDAVRPENSNLREKLAKVESFGDGKLAGEEVLQQQRTADDRGIPYVIFRLPRVIGPRDNSYRLWMYQLWIKHLAQKDEPVMIPRELSDYPISLVYVDDVANAIVKVIARAPDVQDTILNLAYSETFTLPKLVEDIQRELRLGHGKAKWVIDESANSSWLFNCFRRSTLDTKKANTLLSWHATPWNDAIKTTVRFYEKALTDTEFERDRNDVMASLAVTRDPIIREFVSELQQFYLDLKNS